MVLLSRGSLKSNDKGFPMQNEISINQPKIKIWHSYALFLFSVILCKCVCVIVMLANLLVDLWMNAGLARYER